MKTVDRVTDMVNPVGKPKSERLVNHIALVVDTSGSMGQYHKKLVDTLNAQIASVKQNAYGSDQETHVTIVQFDDTARVLVSDAFAESVQPFTTARLTIGGCTALRDGVLAATRVLDHAANLTRDNSFLVIVLTDGLENRSSAGPHAFEDMLRRKQATGRWSFAFLVPPGHGHDVFALGVPKGNIQEWELSDRGFDQVRDTVDKGMGAFYRGRAAGRTATTAFCPDLSQVTQRDLSKLDDLSGRFRSLNVERETDITSFINYKLGHYTIGLAYYQLTKREKIQDHKKLLIRDRRDGRIYGGDQARTLIGISSGPGVSVSVAPGNHANFDIFVNSTSTNRKLVRGTTVLYEL